MGTWRSFDTTEDRSPIVDEAVHAGIDLFDSSPRYGRAEETLAQALAGRREQVLIATKIWSEDIAEGERQAAHALELFGTIDIYQVHDMLNMRGQLALLRRLKSDGKVRAIGATQFKQDAFDELAAWMQTKELDMIQIPYNPLRREAEKLILPLAKELNLGVLVMGPLQAGVLERTPDATQLKELGVQTWPQAVLKWVASHPAISTVLTATKTPGRPSENAIAGKGPLFDQNQRDLVARICSLE